MIPTNELRIGSKYINHADKIETWGLSQFQWLHLGIPIEKIIKSPIPLTHEILEKCGFEFINNPQRYGWYIPIGKRDLCWCYADYVSIEFKIGQLDDFGDTIKDINCKYLHQLQNLYFSLTGEELTINL